MSIEIYNSAASTVLCMTDHDEGVSVRMYLRECHHDGIVDCAIWAGLSWHGKSDENNCHQLFRLEQQAIYLHFYGPHYTVPGTDITPEMPVSIYLYGKHTHGAIELSWADFHNLVEHITRRHR